MTGKRGQKKPSTGKTFPAPKMDLTNQPNDKHCIPTGILVALASAGELLGSLGHAESFTIYCTPPRVVTGQFKALSEQAVRDAEQLLVEAAAAAERAQLLRAQAALAGGLGNPGLQGVLEFQALLSQAEADQLSADAAQSYQQVEDFLVAARNFNRGVGEFAEAARCARKAAEVFDIGVAQNFENPTSPAKFRQRAQAFERAARLYQLAAEDAEQAGDQAEQRQSLRDARSATEAAAADWEHARDDYTDVADTAFADAQQATTPEQAALLTDAGNAALDAAQSANENYQEAVQGVQQLTDQIQALPQ